MKYRTCEVLAALIVSGFCGKLYGQEVNDAPDEVTVKAATEQAATIDICPDQALLKVVGLDINACADRIKELAPVCWHVMDKVVPDYRYERDEKSEYFSMVVLFSSCIRGEMLRGMAKAEREENER